MIININSDKITINKDYIHCFNNNYLNSFNRPIYIREYISLYGNMPFSIKPFPAYKIKEYKYEN